jgi:hypothetical protein
MKTETYDDGSVGYVFEVGDMVEVVNLRSSFEKYVDVGEWGRVYKTDGKGCIAHLRIQLGGYSRSKEAFFLSTGLHTWNVAPMRTETYIKYLESVILSLLSERPDQESDIQNINEKDITFSPINIIELIAKQAEKSANDSKVSGEMVDKVNKQLDLLPGTFQSIGQIAERLKRCKEGSTLYKELCKVYDELNNKCADIMHIIRMKIRGEL